MTHFWIPSWGQEVTLSALGRLRASVPWCRRPRASWRLRCLPPPLPPWTVWVRRLPPPPPPLRPLPRPSKTTPAWPSSSPCSRRAGRRSSSEDHLVGRGAARCSCSKWHNDTKHFDICVLVCSWFWGSGWILFILSINLIGVKVLMLKWMWNSYVGGCTNRPFKSFDPKF